MDLGDIDTIESVVKDYRIHLESVPCTKISDIKLFPNDILLSYFMAENNFSKHQLLDFFSDTDIINECLASYSNIDYDFDGSSDFLNVCKEELGLTRKPNMTEIAYFISSNTGLFAAGLSLKNTKNQFSQNGVVDKLIVANQRKCKFNYPSGVGIDYVALSNETSANISIFEGGYSYPGSREIFIRDIHNAMMCVLHQVTSQVVSVQDYRKEFPQIVYFFTGIIISHELAEIDIVNNMSEELGSLTLEFEAEKKSFKFLNNNRFDMDYYELYHKLRSSTQYINSDVSLKVLNELI